MRSKFTFGYLLLVAFTGGFVLSHFLNRVEQQAEWAEHMRQSPHPVVPHSGMPHVVNGMRVVDAEQYDDMLRSYTVPVRVESTTWRATDDFISDPTVAAPVSDPTVVPPVSNPEIVPPICSP